MDPNTRSTDTVSIIFWRYEMWHDFLRMWNAHTARLNHVGSLTIPKPPPAYFHGITHPGRRFQEMRWDRRPFLSHMDKEMLGRFDPCGAAMWHGCPHDQQKPKIWKDCFKCVAPTYVGLQLAPIDNNTSNRTKTTKSKQVTNKTHTHTLFIYGVEKATCGHIGGGSEICISSWPRAPSTNANLYQLEASPLSTSSNISYWMPLPSLRKVAQCCTWLCCTYLSTILGRGTYWTYRIWHGSSFLGRIS